MVPARPPRRPPRATLPAGQVGRHRRRVWRGARERARTQRTKRDDAGPAHRGPTPLFFPRPSASLRISRERNAPCLHAVRGALAFFGGAGIPPPMTAFGCTLLLCRHGETVDNVSGVVQGQSAGRLTAAGRQQSALLGARLSEARSSFDAAYCSDLGRARETLECVCSATSSIPQPFYTPLLRERAAGVLEGTPLGCVEAAAQAAGVAARQFRPDGGGESWEDVRSRASAFLQLVAAEHCFDERQTNVLVISHGGFIREALAAASCPTSRAGNTAVYELHLTRRVGRKTPAVRLVRANDTRHLSDALTERMSGGE